MAIQTTVNTSNDGNGTVRVLDGTFTGNVSRQIRLEAVPNAGYKFLRWEINKTGVTTLKLHSNVSFLRNSIEAVCQTSTQQEAQQLSQTLFTFETENCTNCIVYLDQFGNTLAPVGYWARGNNTYFVTNFEGRVSTGICPTSSGGGAGGGTGGTGGGAANPGAGGPTNDSPRGGGDESTLL